MNSITSSQGTGTSQVRRIDWTQLLVTLSPIIAATIVGLLIGVSQSKGAAFGACWGYFIALVPTAYWARYRQMTLLGGAPLLGRAPTNEDTAEGGIVHYFLCFSPIALCTVIGFCFGYEATVALIAASLGAMAGMFVASLIHAIASGQQGGWF